MKKKICSVSSARAKVTDSPAEHPLLGRQRRLLKVTPVETLRWRVAVVLNLLFLCLSTSAQAAALSVPNASFESPATEFAAPGMDAWQKAPQPVWYQGGDEFPWDQLMGQFLNTPPGSSNHIDNVEGLQAAFLFALPDVSILQDYNSVSGTNTAPDHAFNVTFEPGNAYRLTVGVMGGGGGMTNAATLELSLYYRDASSNIVTVGATTVTNSAALFPTNTHLIDFEVSVPAVQPSDPWAGRQVGIRIASTAGFDLQGGYWVIDNVRLDALPDSNPAGPLLRNAGLSNGQFQFMLESLPGQFEILTSTNISVPIGNWASLGTLTNDTGTAIFTDTNSVGGTRFYQVRELP